MREAREHDATPPVLIAGAAAAALLLGLSRGLPLGIPGEWVWRANRGPGAVPVQLWPALLVGLALVGICGLIARPGRWTAMSGAARAGWLALLILAVFAMQMALINAAGVPLASPGAIIASPVATTYYSVSLEVRDWRQWVATYPEQMHSLPYHARTHPPGFVLFFMLLRRAAAGLVPYPSGYFRELAEAYRAFGIGPSPADAAAALAAPFVISLLGALSLWPLYLLARHLTSPETAACSTALASGMPALLLFGASPDLIVLAVAVTALCLSQSAWASFLRPGRPRLAASLLAFLAGLSLALGLFLSLGLLPLVGWLALWMAIGIALTDSRGAAAKRAGPLAIAGLAGFVALYLVLYLSLHYRPVAVAREALLAHRSVTDVEAPRSYWKWLVMNPAEAMVFAGLPLAVMSIWSAARRRAGTPRSPSAFLLAWLIVCALLDISGTVRGEVGRIWLFLMWPAALAAGPWLARVRNRAGVVALLVLLSVWQAILMRGYLTLYDIF
jgi:hypothetical protein